MKPFTFKMPTRIVFGEGASADMTGLCREFGASRVMLVTDKIIGATPGFAAICAGLKAGNIDFCVYDDTVPEPPVEVVDQAAEVLKASGCELVIAVGGGSSIDNAKAICMLKTNEGSVREYLFGGSKTIQNRPLPLICVPTTAGSGSEVTASSVIEDKEKGIKLSITHDWVIPPVAVVDPLMQKDMPASITAATGMDALTHAVEAYVSNNAQPVTDALALQAIEMIGKNLRTAVCNPQDREARSAMALASVLAAGAFSNAGLGAVHGISQSMGGIAHVSHGVGNALLLPYVCERNLPGRMERFAKIARLLGENTDGLSLREAAALCPKAMHELLEDLQLPCHLREVKVTREMLPAIVEGAMAYRLLHLNPVKLIEKDVWDILEKAY